MSNWNNAPVEAPLALSEDVGFDFLNAAKKADLNYSRLPKWFADCIQSIVKADQVDEGIAIGVALGALSAHCHTVCNVKTPTGTSSPTSLFVMIFAETGEGKSRIEKLFFEHYDKTASEEDASYFAKLFAYEKQFDEWITWEASAESPVRPQRPIKPCKPHNITADFTPQFLFDAVANNNPEYILKTAEGGMIAGGAAMSKDSKATTFTYLATLWEGGTISVDRKGTTVLNRTNKIRTLTSVRNRRFITMVQMQPKFSKILFDQNGAESGQGFLQRCITIFCERKRPSARLPTTAEDAQMRDELVRLRKASVSPINENLLKIRQLAKTMDASDPAGYDRLPYIDFEESAKYLANEALNFANKQCGPGGLYEAQADVVSRLYDNVCRVAALFALYRIMSTEHILDFGSDTNPSFDAEHRCGFLKNGKVTQEDVIAAATLMFWSVNNSVEERSVATRTIEDERVAQIIAFIDTDSETGCSTTTTELSRHKVARQITRSGTEMQKYLEQAVKSGALYIHQERYPGDELSRANRKDYVLTGKRLPHDAKPKKQV